ncbi:MAG TPA: aminopeptidase [Candidatus Binataceae bacterium]|nr:aminopeptidase [Candidatus Binataceae bacterium]
MRLRLLVFIRGVFAATAILVLSGCYAGYLMRAAYEGGRILWNRKPISTELASTDLSKETRDKLETILAVRKFAADDLGLNVGGAYETIAPVHESAIIHVVMAAPRNSLAPYTWWFPIVGSVPYRGYFEESHAVDEARYLEDQGLDTMVRPAVAFSSLGFFDDPVLSNMLKVDRVELAGVIIHELFHRTYYLASDAMFDESAATYVGNAGAIAFFTKTEGAASEDAKSARDVLESDMMFADFLEQSEAALLRIYMLNIPIDDILKQRQVAFAQIQANYAKLEPSLSGLERFDLDKEPLNNAVLVNYLLYFHDLKNFAKLNQQNNNDLRATIAQIISLAKAHEEDPFYAIWQATHPAPTASH